VQAEASIDHFGPKGRVKGKLLLFAASPASLRMDIVSPFGVTLATLTSNGEKFGLLDMREKQFLYGPASSCNLARMTLVPIPPHALVSLLRGTAPILKHEPRATTLRWDRSGAYVLSFASTRGASEEIRVAPHPDDWQKPWQSQRMRLTQVSVEQTGTVLYRAELSGHFSAKMSVPRVDDDGIEAPIPTSGPECHAEVPRAIHLEVPGSDQDVVFRYDDVSWNPPLPDGAFVQEAPAGLARGFVDCPR